MLITPEEEELLKDFEENPTVTDPENPTEDPENPVEDPKEEPEVIEPTEDPAPTEDPEPIINPVEDPEEDPTPDPEEDENKNVFKPMELKSKNVKLQVDNLDELVKLATQGLDYTKKTQMLSPYRQRIKTMEANGITEEDLVLLKDIKGGDVTAFKKLMTDVGIEDTYDIDSAEGTYTPTSLEQVPETQIETEDIIAEIQGDVQGSTDLIALTNSITDNSFIETLGNDAKALKAVYEDVKSGIATEAVERANKIVALNPNVSFGQAYVKSAMDIRSQTTPEPKEAVKETVVKKDVPLSKKMKSGLNNGSRSPAPSGKVGIDDILDMPDAEFMSKLDDILK